MRIVRICSEAETRDQRLIELKEMLLEREYPVGLVNSAINRARAVPRVKALQYVAKPEVNMRPKFVVTYDPRLPNIDQILKKHWRASGFVDKSFTQTFPEPPLIAYKRHKNLRDITVRAKVSSRPQRNPSRKVRGVKSCGKQCLACPYIKEGKLVKGPSQG